MPEIAPPVMTCASADGTGYLMGETFARARPASADFHSRKQEKRRAFYAALTLNLILPMGENEIQKKGVFGEEILET